MDTCSHESVSVRRVLTHETPEKMYFFAYCQCVLILRSEVITEILACWDRAIRTRFQFTINFQKCFVATIRTLSALRSVRHIFEKEQRRRQFLLALGNIDSALEFNIGGLLLVHLNFLREVMEVTNGFISLKE